MDKKGISRLWSRLGIAKYILLIVCTSLITLAIASKLTLIKDNTFTNIYSGVVSVAGDLSGIVVAVCAVIALQQLNIAKRANQYVENRNAAEKSIQLCQYFKDVIIEQSNCLVAKFDENEIPYNKKDVNAIQGRLYLKQWGEKIDTANLLEPMVSLANSLEQFSIQVKEKIVNEEIVFCPTSEAFITACRIVLPFVYLSLMSDKRSYRNLLYIYQKWCNRINVEDSQNELKRHLEQSKKFDS